MWLLLLLLMFDHTLLYILLCLSLCCPQMHNLPFNIFLVYFFFKLSSLYRPSCPYEWLLWCSPFPCLRFLPGSCPPCPVLCCSPLLPLPPPHLTVDSLLYLWVFPVCCFVFVHFSKFKPFLLWTTFFPVTCPCLWLPMLYLSSAHGGLPPTPAAGVPCPSPARHGYRGQAHQAAGQLLWSGDPKDGCLSLWGGH